MNDEPDRRPGARGAARAAPRLALADGSGEPLRMCELREPFRLGFGEECDIRLEGAEGPPVLFQVEEAPGTLLVARVMVPAECENYVDLRIDGEPVQAPLQGLSPGSSVEILDKASGRRYQVTVEQPPRGRALRPRHLAVVMLVLAIVGAAFGGYLYRGLEGARTGLARTEAELAESLARIESTEAALDEAVGELRAMGEASARGIRTEFDQRLEEIERGSRERLDRLAERDVQGRARLVEEARRQTEALRDEFSGRMVESYRQLKAMEQRLMSTLVERIGQLEPEGARFKRAFERAGPASLLLRTSYEVYVTRDDSVTEAHSLGTGFVVSPSGLAITAQHVLFPWRFDSEFLVLERLGLVRVVPGSTRWQAWPLGARVFARPDDPESVQPETGYGSHEGKHPLRLLYAPEPETTLTMVSSPLGVIDIAEPVPGATDSAVLQLADFSGPMPHIPPLATSPAPAPLDEVLLVGYPFSRLADGIARPQAVRGFVRRASGGLLELDAAVHPGMSGGPVLDADGALVGMVMATLNSDVYGVALPADSLAALLVSARERVREEEAALAAMGCDPGPVDGTFDAATLAAYRCKEQQEAAGEAAPVREGNDPS